MAPMQTKLIHHRWDMHMLQALSKRDSAELVRVFTEIKELPENAVDTKVKIFGFGAPMQFHTFGFFDKTIEASSKPLFERVVDGDTMLLLALRPYDLRCAIALIKLGADLYVKNSAGESPLQTIFDAMAFLRLHPEDDQQGQQQDREKDSTSDVRLLNLRAEYEALFDVVHDELKEFHKEKKVATKRELLALYEHFAPDRVSKIPAQLEAYVYREHILLECAKEKYLT